MSNIIYKSYSEAEVQEVLTDFGHFMRGNSSDHLSLIRSLSILDYFVYGSTLTEYQEDYHRGLILEAEIRLDLMESQSIGNIESSDAIKLIDEFARASQSTVYRILNAGKGAGIDEIINHINERKQ